MPTTETLLIPVIGPKMAKLGARPPAWPATSLEDRQKLRQWTLANAAESPAVAGFERTIMLGTVLVVLLILMLLGSLPTWPYSRSWGYAPSGGLGAVLVILLILVLVGIV